jgi:hypothetical protein
MNLLEKYSTHCGVKISNPSISSSYFPIPVEKYIIIDNRNRNKNAIYDLYEDVISYLHPIFEKNNIHIINFTFNEKNVIPKTIPYVGLPKKQEAYLLKNSLCNICSDNISSFISDGLDVPSIGLYSLFPSEVSKPIWNRKHEVIESSRLGNLPSYGENEMPKSVNFISPEEISNKILDLLGLEPKTRNKTLYTGDIYSIKSVEVIPNFIPDFNFLKGKSINIRMDYCFNEEILPHWISGRVANILTDKRINLDILRSFKENIIQFTVDINDNFDEEYLKAIQSMGINLKVFCSNKEKIKKYRFDFFDFEVEESIFKFREDFGEKDVSHLKFLSSKILFSNGEKYSCKSSLDKGIKLNNTLEPVIDEESFWKDLDYFRIIDTNE